MIVGVKPSANSATAMPNAATIANTMPKSRNVCGDSRAIREAANTANPIRIDTTAVQFCTGV